MSVVGIALRGFGKALKKFEKKADKVSEKMIKEMNSPKLKEKATGYTKLGGLTAGAAAVMPSAVEKPDPRIRKSRGGDVMPKRNKKNFRPTKSGAGMTRAGVMAYRRANPGSKLKTAVTGKVKKGSKAAKRRKSYCARSAGQMKKFPKAARDPNSRLRQARRRWKC
jgi:Sec-independent protein translocase protein TatA